MVKLPAERAAEADVTREVAVLGSLVLEPCEPAYRVLIIEDDEDSRVLLERLVRNAGFPGASFPPMGREEWKYFGLGGRTSPGWTSGCRAWMVWRQRDRSVRLKAGGR